MDAAAIATLVAAIQALAPAAAPAAGNLILPYDGNEFNLNTRHGQALYSDRSKVLPVMYSGKLSELYMWLAEVQHRASTCRWNTGGHQVCAITRAGDTFDLIKQYGIITQGRN